MGCGHHVVWCQVGMPRAAVGENVWTSGLFRGAGTGLNGT